MLVYLLQQCCIFLASGGWEWGCKNALVRARTIGVVGQFPRKLRSFRGNDFAGKLFLVLLAHFFPGVAQGDGAVED